MVKAACLQQLRAEWGNRTSANVKPWFLWNYLKIWPAVSEKKIFEEFLHIHKVQKAPIHQSHVYWRIKILQTSFQNSHPRNISVKLFQNLTSSFREEIFLRTSLCPYSAKKPPPPPPPPPRPCCSTDQNFMNNFWKVSPQEQSCEIISKSDKRFTKRRILKNFSEVHQVKKASPPPHSIWIEMYDGYSLFWLSIFISIIKWEILKFTTNKRYHFMSAYPYCAHRHQSIFCL